MNGSEHISSQIVLKFSFSMFYAQKNNQYNKQYIEENKKIQVSLLNYINDCNTDFDDIETLFQTNKINEDINKTKDFLLLLSNASNNHYRNSAFISKIEKILVYLAKDIKQYFSNLEIYNIFKNNKLILLLLVQHQILTIDETIFYFLKNSSTLKYQYCYFFYPEIKNFLSKEEEQQIEQELLKICSDIFDDFYYKRSKCENEKYICSLIRQDFVEKFIEYVNRINLPVNSKINSSIFETHPFLIKHEATLIEYTAFFGSIQIFRYLFNRDVVLTSSLWLYAIHGQSPEIIHFLEENHILPPDEKYESCLIESIKCHQIDISNYIIDNLIDPNLNESYNQHYFNEEIIKKVLRYHNFQYFPDDFTDKSAFYLLWKYNYEILVNIYLKENEENIKSIIILR